MSFTYQKNLNQQNYDTLYSYVSFIINYLPTQFTGTDEVIEERKKMLKLIKQKKLKTIYTELIFTCKYIHMVFEEYINRDPDCPHVYNTYEKEYIDYRKTCIRELEYILEQKKLKLLKK